MPATSEPLRRRLGARWARPVVASPEAAFAALEAEHEHVVWLDSSSGGAHIVGTGHVLLVVRDGKATLDGRPVPGDALEALERARASLPGVWVGWLGYEAGVRMLGLEAPAGPHPEAAWLLLDRWLVVDDDGLGELQSRRSEDAWSLPGAATATAVPPNGDGTTSARTAAFAPEVPHWREDEATYAARVEACMEHIREGESYLLCLTTEVRTPPIDAVATAARLRAASPVHHGAFLRLAGVTLLSASPESFLHVDGGVATTKPIKGTRRRGAHDDAALALELYESEKERAENVMIVDLCRNDLQRVAVPGGVEVARLLDVESYETVHQLVSTVRARLRPGVGPLDVARAMFPAGSMTGAPKRRTVELLRELEGAPRGVYSGCFGFLAGDLLDLAMVIRSVIADERGATIGVGGGVTALSEPAFEVEETRLKARALLASLVPR